MFAGTLAEDNDESIVKNFLSETFDNSKMENFDTVLKSSIRDITRKQFHKDYIGKDMPRGDTMQKWHIFRKNEKFSKRSDGF